MSKLSTAALAALALGSLALGGPARADGAQISNDLALCNGNGPAVRVTVSGIRPGGGNIRVQTYHGTAAEWLAKGRWLTRIQQPARAGTMVFCLPVSEPGSYGVAVRHDVNGNGKTDISRDGGGMSNNPSINIFNLGKPSYKKTAFSVGDAPKKISITMKYM